MALQKQVNTEFAVGVAGDLVNVTDKVYTAINPIAETAVKAGAFCFAGTDPLKQAKAGGTSVLGFVQRVYQYLNESLTVGATMEIPVGSGLSVIKKGYCYATSTTEATVGQKVLADATTGAISTGASATSGTNVDTGWTVMKGGAVGEVIVIGNW